MKKMIKWLGIIAGALAVLIILILIIIPFFFDLQTYKPLIEREASKVIGRPLTIGGDLKLSLFPWAGLAFSDLHIGNADGFTEKDFVYIKSFDVKVKFLPLLLKDIQVKKLVIAGPRIMLEKTKDSRANWQGLGKKDATGAALKVEKNAREASQDAIGGLPIKGLTVAEFTVREGELLYIDHNSETRHEIKDLDVELNDVSLEEPFKLIISASAGGKPVSIEGRMGPLGKEPGKGAIMVDLDVKAMDLLSMNLEGSVTDLALLPRFDLSLSTDRFSPRDLINGLIPDYVLVTKDPDVLRTMSVKMKIKGSTGNIEVSEGTLELDQSKMTFSAMARDFDKPDLAFKMKFDRLDADRYLPPAEEKTVEEKPEKVTKRDYSLLRKIVLECAINMGELKIKGIQIKDLQARLKGKNGVFSMDPVSLDAYEGKMAGVAGLDFKRDVPVAQANVEAKDIQAGKIISDFMKKDFLEGKITASVSLSMSGDSAELIKKSLDGKGEVRLKDGAIVGIDLAGMVNNVKMAFGMAEAGEGRERTDFTEFFIPFEISDGVVNTQNTSLVSPGLRVSAKGNADLVKETLDFRVEPTFVKTIKGQGDSDERSGVTVPVLVTGSFTKPKFSPDLSGVVQKTIEKGLKRLIKGKAEKEGEEGKTQPAEDAVKGLLKGIFGK
ncbi:MAG TPA: AsmA family protein [Desulfatiglandales bacterium]|nr:AsmA family protein [Desulfatiglandales bacterium]